MGQPIFQVDAFTDRPFTGNPAAVCLLPAPQEEQWMQQVAREINLSETAFLTRQTDGFNLRWFTPVMEVDLCGHATLASAHILWEQGFLPEEAVARFHTRSGLLTAERKGEWIELDFPAEPEEESGGPAELAQALGVTPKYLGKNRMDYLVEVDSEDLVRKVTPNFTLLEAIPARGIIITSLASSPGYDFVSRFFAPRAGIHEDPVTGSAHCYLGPFWSERLQKTELIAYQASARGGIVRIRMGKQRVYLGGQAITVLRGELL